MRSRLHRFAAVAVMVAAAHGGVLGATTTPAVAAACSSADGVTVVVDFHGLGGGVQQVCDANGGGTKASTLFTSNGFDLTYAQKQPGFVCRIDGKPADDPCVNTPPADAYWGLWWSDGSKSTWTYSSLGAASLEIPDGGSVAFSWNSGSGTDKPGVSPPAHKAEEPSPSPTGGGDGGGNGGGSGGGNGGDNGGGGNDGGGATATPTPEPSAPTSTEPSESESVSPTPTESESEAESEEASATESESPTVEDDLTPASEESETTASPADADEGGLPGWLASAVVVLLFAAAAAVVYLRRRRTSAGPTGPAGP